MGIEIVLEAIEQALLQRGKGIHGVRDDTLLMNIHKYNCTYNVSS
jgi:hypothetical protein